MQLGQMGTGPFGVALFITHLDAFRHFPHFTGFGAYYSETAALKSSARQVSATAARVKTNSVRLVPPRKTRKRTLVRNGNGLGMAFHASQPRTAPLKLPVQLPVL